MNKIKELSISSYEITLELFKVMVPTLIVIKILEEIGFVHKSFSKKVNYIEIYLFENKSSTL